MRIAVLVLMIIASCASLVALINILRVYNLLDTTQMLRVQRSNNTILTSDTYINDASSSVALNESLTVNSHSEEASQQSKDDTRSSSSTMRTRSKIATHTTIMDSILEVEQKYNSSKNCKLFGGSDFVKSLQDSELSLLTKHSLSTLTSYRNHAMDIFLAENVSIAINNIGNEDRREFTLEVNGDFLDDEDSRSRIDISESIGDSKLRNMTMTIKERNDGIPECSEYYDSTVMLIDNNIDTWNWWFFLISVLKHFVTLAVVESHVFVGNYSTDLRLFSTLNDATQSRPFPDIFAFMFDSQKRLPQIWKEAPIHGSMDKKNDEKSNNRHCFRKLLWSPGGTQGGNHILINRSHEYSHCFSSIVYSYAMHLKTSLQIPTLPRPAQPRVVWVARDTSREANPTNWQTQRIIGNQDQITLYLKKKCKNMGIDFIVASFYGEETDTAAQEQALFVSRANIMIGIHGAGLNMFHFMPFYSVVVELHLGTNLQKNSENYVNHIYEAKYIGVNAKVREYDNNKLAILDQDATWKTLQNAIEEWRTLPEKLKVG